MARAGKILAHHRGGQGKIAARNLTALQSGPIRASKTAADMFVDVSPYLSLAGLDFQRTYNRRGNTSIDGDESHIQHRTRGKNKSAPIDTRSHHAIVAKGQFKNGR